ncbi:unnamed protein product [Pseudo-nitzschia multistriata]|uniref:MerC domain-containing protein n=1 Tax=Pseudo-nitzschia multistriata TaxID=183589 RepID=A0A448ZGB4_9STRA|nr:unnamed protein product [Pseudo-nitzschia multistriata]
MSVPCRLQRKEGNQKVATLLLLCTVACARILAPNSSPSFPVARAFAFARNGETRTVSTKETPEQLSRWKLKQPTQKKFRTSPLSSTDDAFRTQPAATTTKPVINGASSTEATFESHDNAFEEVQKNKNNISQLLDKFRAASNFASILCVLDCTLLPIITVCLPLLGLVNLSTDKLQMIDSLGHTLALSFVLPVASLTTAINYWGHRRKRIASVALLGILLVGTANSHWHLPHSWPAILTGAIHKVQSCGGTHPSVWHRIANTGGCALLLASNYLSQQQEGCATHKIAGASDCCGHDHNH